MKLPLLLSVVLTVSATAAPKSGLPAELRELAIGDTAPDFALPGIDDRTHRLADYRGARLLMIAFISNHCPDSHAAEARLKQLVNDYRAKGLALVAINPNHPDGLRLDELGYSKYNDGFDDMKKYAAEQGFNFPYLYDGETQATAKAYGCLATPHVFLFDADRKLRYRGQFDDSRYADPATVKSPDARNAVAALLAGRPVPVEVTKPHGCSTKWNSKKSLVAEADAKWAKSPVDVEVIDAAGLARLRANGTRKVRLFNVWATWCAPCVAEFPELAITARKFGLRDFELITISVDEPADAPRVKAFLEKQGTGLPARLKPSVEAEGRKTNSYLFARGDLDACLRALDPGQASVVPHTLLVGTRGEVIWRHSGLVDGETLRNKILEHMGPYYVPAPVAGKR